MAAHGDAWRHSIFKVVNEFEENRRDAQKVKEVKGKIELPQTLHRMLSSPVDIAHVPAFPA